MTGFVSDGATRRALQMVGNGAEVGVEILNFAGGERPVLLGIPSGSNSWTRRDMWRTWSGTGAGVRDEGKPDTNRHGPAAVGRRGPRPVR